MVTILQCLPRHLDSWFYAVPQALPFQSDSPVRLRCSSPSPPDDTKATPSGEGATPADGEVATAQVLALKQPGDRGLVRRPPRLVLPADQPVGSPGLPP